MQYLHSGRSNFCTESGILSVPNASKCRKLIFDLLVRITAASPGGLGTACESGTDAAHDDLSAEADQELVKPASRY